MTQTSMFSRSLFQRLTMQRNPVTHIHAILIDFPILLQCSSCFLNKMNGCLWSFFVRIVSCVFPACFWVAGGLDYFECRQNRSCLFCRLRGLLNCPHSNYQWTIGNRKIRIISISHQSDFFSVLWLVWIDTFDWNDSGLYDNWGAEMCNYHAVRDPGSTSSNDRLWQ